MLKFFNLKNSFLAFLALVLVLSFSTLPASAAKFYPLENQSSEDIRIPASNENVYAAGQKITVSELVQKDVILAGEKIEITAPVGRSAILAGEEITINNRVGGAVRVAGSKVTLSGTFNEEVIVAASEVIIKDAQISGDLFVAADKVEIQNSRIFGDSYVSYGSLNGDLKAQTVGEVKESKENYNFSEDLSKAFVGLGIWFIIAQQISSLLFLLIICLWLYKRNALILKDIRFDQKFGLDFLLGLGIFVLMVPIFALSFIFQFYFLATTIGGLILLTFILTECLKPFYLANLLKNSLKINLDIKILIPLVYIVTLILLYIPFLNILAGLFFFIILLANYGYFVRKGFVTIDNSLKLVGQSHLNYDIQKTSDLDADSINKLEKTEETKIDSSKTGENI